MHVVVTANQAPRPHADRSARAVRDASHWMIQGDPPDVPVLERGASPAPALGSGLDVEQPDAILAASLVGARWARGFVP